MSVVDLAKERAVQERREAIKARVRGGQIREGVARCEFPGGCSSASAGFASRYGKELCDTHRKIMLNQEQFHLNQTVNRTEE
jgi:hypothetical protein